MAVAYNTVTSVSFEGVTSTNVSHTASGSNRLAVAHVSSTPNSSTISSITYNGSAMTLVNTSVETDFELRASLYRYIAPGTSSQTCAINFSGAAYGALGVTSYTGVDQTTPISNSSIANGDNDSATVTVTSATDEMVTDIVCFFNNNVGTPAVGAAQTSRFYTKDSWGDAGVASTEAGAASVTMSWTLNIPSGYQHWAQVAASLKAASTGPIVHDASATLSGLGALAGVAVAQRFASTSMAGLGALQAAAVKQTFASTALSGSGTLQAAALRLIPSSATFSGAGTLSATGLVSIPLQAALSGSGTMQATALRTIPASASFSNSSVLSATALLIAIASASLTGSGLLAASAEGFVTHFASATLSGLGDMSAAGVRVVNATTNMVANGAMSATAFAVRFASTSLSGVGTMSARVQSAISRYVRYALNLLPGGIHRGKLTGR
jgi:hypothetical protein